MDWCIQFCTAAHPYSRQCTGVMVPLSLLMVCWLKRLVSGSLPLYVLINGALTEAASQRSLPLSVLMVLWLKRPVSGHCKFKNSKINFILFHCLNTSLKCVKRSMKKWRFIHADPLPHHRWCNFAQVQKNKQTLFYYNAEISSKIISA